jgi:hypothetical protein
MVVALAVVAAGVVVTEFAPRHQGKRQESREDYWWARALGRNAHNPATAILVSRFRFERLRPLKSWHDEAALRDYVEWADRPEAAGFRNGVVTAKVSANDLILLRVPAAKIETAAHLYRDPIGFAVLDPGRTGWVRIPVTLLVAQTPVPTLPPGLPSKPVPALEAAVAAGDHTVVVYGRGLKGESVKVYSRAGAGQVVYDSALQLNARVPSLDEVAVEVNGMRSDWIEVQR